MDSDSRTIIQNLNHFKLRFNHAKFHSKKNNDLKTRNKLFHIKIDSNYLNTNCNNHHTIDNNQSHRNNITIIGNKKNSPLPFKLPVFNINLPKNTNELLYASKKPKFPIESIENKKKINFNDVKQLMDRNKSFNKFKKLKKTLEINSRFNQPKITDKNNNNFFYNDNTVIDKRLVNNYFSYQNFNESVDSNDKISRIITKNNTIDNISILPSKNEKRNFHLIEKNENNNLFIKRLKVNKSIDANRIAHNKKVKLPSLQPKISNFNEILSKRNMKKLLQIKVSNLITKANNSTKRNKKLIRNESYLNFKECKKVMDKKKSKIITINENIPSECQSESDINDIKDNENKKENDITDYLEIIKKLEFRNEELINLDIFDVNNNNLYDEYDYKFEVYFKEKYSRKNKK